MTTTDLKPITITAATAIAGVVEAAEKVSVDELIAKIKNKDDKARGPAWQGAGPAGAAAVKPLAEVMTDKDFEIARAATRGLWVIVRHAGRPGAAKEAKAVADQLVSLLASGATQVRRETLWMLSEIGGDEAVPAMAALLTDKELREDARCALQRIPGRKSLAALKDAFAVAPDDFKYHLAESLRDRGEKVKGYPTQKLKPTRQTSVKQGQTT